MIEDYVPYIAAQTLKQVGFNEPTKAVFMNGQCMLLDSDSYNSLFGTSDTCSAPTMQMAFKWLRDERYTHVEITADGNGFAYTIKHYSIEKGWVERKGQDRKTFPTYEDAACEGLITGLKYLYYYGKEN